VYYSHPPQLTYKQVDYDEQALFYILVLYQPIIIPVCKDLRILQYSGEYYIILYRGSCKCVNIIIVSGLIHPYHTEKLVAGNDLLITSLDQGNVFTSHSVEI
jgi:hypothetical protein